MGVFDLSHRLEAYATRLAGLIRWELWRWTTIIDTVQRYGIDTVQYNGMVNEY